ncbi:hypothetical protein [Agromyces archimandritae]|uniref:Uncharacterized protein n=1 Tax=Agromyces archimandritae TaxID=2781962 RepID=A0A975IPI1_9MICO|nr:hypothetical protein [Agromyces archimandritae]QTX05299.1 hypothetical protein G127AT_03465 [Agromyces archimandritae]
MKKSIVFKLSAAAIAAAAMLGVGSAANAASNYIGFDVNLPRLQLWQIGFATQSTGTSTPAQVKVSAIGSTYTLDARTALEYSDAKGAIASNINEGQTVSLNKPFKGNVGLNVRNHTLAAVLVQAQGQFRSN